MSARDLHFATSTPWQRYLDYIEQAKQRNEIPVSFEVWAEQNSVELTEDQKDVENQPISI